MSMEAQLYQKLRNVNVDEKKKQDNFFLPVLLSMLL